MLPDDDGATDGTTDLDQIVFILKTKKGDTIREVVDQLDGDYLSILFRLVAQPGDSFTREGIAAATARKILVHD